MIYKSNSFQNWLKALNIFIFLYLSSLILVACKFFELKEQQFMPLKQPYFSKFKEKQYALNFPKTKEDTFQFPMMDLKNSLKVNRIPSRPNKCKDEKLFIDFKGMSYPLNSFKLYFTLQNNQINVTRNKSNSFLQFENFNSQVLTIKQVCNLGDPFNKMLQKEYSLPIKTLKSKDLAMTKPFLEFKNCEFLGLDQLNLMKGSSTYLIKVNGKFYNINEGTSFIFDNKWKIGESDEMPYAYISTLTSENLIIKFWGNQNNKYDEVVVKKKYLPKKSIRIADLVGEVHMRNKNQISLLIGKQKLFLSEGDIIVKRNGKWSFFSEEIDDGNNEMYLIFNKIIKKQKKREIEINILEKNRVILHNFVVPVSKGSFAKKLHP